MPIAKILLKDFQLVFIIVSVCILGILVYKRLVRDYWALTLMLTTLFVRSFVSTALMFYRKPLGLSLPVSYKAYFYTYWLCDIFIAAFQVMVIYGVFSFALKPLKGLHEVGKNIFRWVAAVSVMVSLAIMFGPHGLTTATFNVDLAGMVTVLAQQVDQALDVLTLCLLLFVCLTTKPLGLTYQSRIFGTLLGLGVVASTNLVQTAWSGNSPAYSLYSPIAVFGVVSELCAVIVWGAYFVLPEPERKLILLPTVSPYFFWNHISEALGDEPGHVVVGGLTPAMFSEAEMAMFSAPDSDLPNAPLVTEFNVPTAQIARFANAS